MERVEVWLMGIWVLVGTIFSYNTLFFAGG
jgi:hypothetical protein